MFLDKNAFSVILEKVLQVPVMKKKVAVTVALFCLFIFALAIPVRASFVVWDKTYGGADTDIAEAVIQTSDGGYVLASTIIILVDDIPYDNDAWLIKTDSEGIIPEFPSWLLISLFIVSTLLAVISYRKLSKKTGKP